jgi:hypothetical protein
MLPKAIATLQQATVSGPIIILTTTSSICFALIVTSSSDVQYLELPEFILPEVTLLAELSRGLSNPAFDFERFVETREHRLDLQARLLGGREGTIKVDPEEVFRRLLADLWNNIVKPVFKALNLQARTIPLYVIINLIFM